jgi:uncharacterized alkaline shock family protein YloU
MGELMDEGKTTIAPEVLITIARLTTLNVPGVSRMCVEPPGMERIFKRNFTDGVRVDVKNDTVFTDIYVILHKDVNMRDVSRNIQQQVTRAISEMVGMQVGSIDVHIEDIDYAGENEA